LRPKELSIAAPAGENAAAGMRCESTARLGAGLEAGIGSEEEVAMRVRPTLSIAGLLVMATTVAGCAAATPTSSPAASATASAEVSATTPSASAGVLAKLGPNGVGALSLGISKTDATATGIVTGVTGTTGSCGQVSDGRLIDSLPASDEDVDGRLYFSTNTGKLVMIAANAAVTTPQGIHLGSTPAQVKKAYPSWKGDEGASQGLGYVKVPNNAQAVFRIYIDRGHVTELTLQAADQDCAE